MARPLAPTFLLALRNMAAAPVHINVSIKHLVRRRTSFSRCLIEELLILGRFCKQHRENIFGEILAGNVAMVFRAACCGFVRLWR